MKNNLMVIVTYNREEVNIQQDVKADYKWLDLSV